MEKTGLLAGLVSWFAGQGLKSVVVSLSLEFDPGDAGKDTWKFRRAGANPVALVAPGVYQTTSVIEADPGIILDQTTAALAPSADLALIDLEDSRLAASASSVLLGDAAKSGFKALVSSIPESSPFPVFELQQLAAVGRFILECLSD
ncbi:MAG: molybdopterin-guanine dinucleotide biosynthesis protein MobB [Deltaproteobacteria bacterium]|nr:molybdopterin-guanine dinucleotide biosynthesis protein MobB [Deltaproteobacteria bacterium]